MGQTPDKIPTSIEQIALRRALQKIDSCKLTIIQSQPGFGKTTLLEQLYRKTEPAKLWLTISESDNDSTKLLNKIVLGLDSCGINVNTSFINQLDIVPMPSLDPLINTMVSECVESQIKYIFIDDVDLLTNEESNDIINGFLSDTNDFIRLVVTCNTNPNFSSSRFLLNNNVLLIDDDLLRFTSDDVRHFFSLKNLVIANDDLLDELVLLTDGWPSAISFVLSTIGQGNELIEMMEELKSGNKNLALYFSERAYNTQSKEIKSFMHKISVADQFNLSLCNNITQNNNAHEIILKLIESNSFITPISDGWYKFNPLYLQFLRERALLKLGNQNLSEYKLRLALWLYENNLKSDAIDIALEIKNFDLASKWIFNDVKDVVKSLGQHNKYIEWIQALPHAQLDKYPLLRVNYALVLGFTKQFDKAEENIDILLAHKDTFDENTRFIVERQIDMASCIILGLKDDINGLVGKSSQWIDYWGEKDNFQQSYDYHFELAVVNLIKGFSCKCMSLFPEGKTALIESSNHFEIAGSHFGKAWARAIMAVLYAKQGFHHEALNEAKEGLEEVKEHLGIKSHAGYILSALIGAIYYEYGDIKLASKYVQDGLPYIKEQSSTDILIATFETKYKVLLADDSLEEGIGLLKDGIKWSSLMGLSRLQLTLVDNLVTVLVINDRLKEAENYANTYDINYINCQDYDPAIYEYKIISKSIVHLLMAHNKYKQAISILQQLIKRSRQLNQMRQLAQWLMLISIAYFKSNDEKDAFIAIKESLEIARTRNYKRMFIDEGLLLANLLSYVYKQDSSRPSQSFVKKLLNDFKDFSLIPTQNYEKLTLKENEIILLLETGLSNKQIANEISISEGTLKWHLHNIYLKFNAKNRTQALRVAHEEGYI